MSRPKLHEQRELERIEANLQAKCRDLEQQLGTLRQVLEAVQEAISVTADLSRNVPT